MDAFVHSLTLMRTISVVLTLLVASAFASTLPAQSAEKTAASRSLSLKDKVDGPGDFPVVTDGTAVEILLDQGEAEVVGIAANLLADDIEHVSGVKPKVGPVAPSAASAIIVAGTVGKSALIDRLIATGKLDAAAKIRGRWETTLYQIVADPFPGVGRALVIAGSDRRGTAYGLIGLSEPIGVSPWCWWADVPPRHQKNLVLTGVPSAPSAPGVKYRGIFINDEDWGLHQWAKQTFEPAVGAIGPKTYAKVFELMLRLRLNYIWPAMHEVSREFHSLPENIETAHRYGIVAGASHCEPMLFNNANWKESERGKWDYSVNRDTIHAVWEEQAKTRGDKEAVWGLGIRGIHDRGMQGPKPIPARIDLLTEVFRDQRALLEKYVTKDWGPVAQAFVPYKEVLTLYDAGLPVPDDVTLVWVDDNFGYIRRLGKPAERTRPGGAGVYWHLSYYGSPHSYLWINTTAPALMWEELHKAWENDARTIWVINVGDIKPAEVGIDYFAKLAWNPEAVGPDAQPHFLQDFAATQFGRELAAPIGNLLNEFYRLGTIRKPELMNRAWALSLTDRTAAQLRHDYETLLKTEETLAASIPSEMRDAFFEIVGFPARILGATGLIFLADRSVQFGDEPVATSTEEIAHWRGFLEKQVERFNQGIGGGKWNHMMPGLVTASDFTKWNSQVRWPWGEKPTDAAKPTKPLDDAHREWRDAASAEEQRAAAGARWTRVEGLGHTGRAMALKPAGLKSSWPENDAAAPSLSYNFKTNGGPAEVLIDFMPTFRLYPGMQLRVGVSIDNGTPALVEVPGSSGKDDENGPTRSTGIQNNYVRARVPIGDLSPGAHCLKISAVDPGVVIDRVALPVE